MSRKRLFINNSVPTPHIQAYQYEYYRPGCYYIPQIEHQVTPYFNTYTDQWLPYCNTATYVIDRYGGVNYLSDFEYQLQVPASPLPQPRPQEIIYNFYNDGDTELSSLPQIEEEDSDDNQEACIPPKRKRVNSDNRFEDKSKELPKNQREDLRSNRKNVYRSNEGYLVEEPNDNIPENA